MKLTPEYWQHEKSPKKFPESEALLAAGEEVTARRSDLKALW